MQRMSMRRPAASTSREVVAIMMMTMMGTTIEPRPCAWGEPGWALRRIKTSVR